MSDFTYVRTLRLPDGSVRSSSGPAPVREGEMGLADRVMEAVPPGSVYTSQCETRRVAARSTSAGRPAGSVTELTTDPVDEYRKVSNVIVLFKFPGADWMETTIGNHGNLITDRRFATPGNWRPTLRQMAADRMAARNLRAGKQARRGMRAPIGDAIPEVARLGL